MCEAGPACPLPCPLPVGDSVGAAWLWNSEDFPKASVTGGLRVRNRVYQVKDLEQHCRKCIEVEAFGLLSGFVRHEAHLKWD